MPNQPNVLERSLLEQPTNYSLPPYGGPTPPLPQQSVENLVVHGSTPLSQIGANICPAPPSENSGGPLSPAPTTPGGSADDCDSDFTSRGGRKQKRGVLPKHATSVMRSWLFQHLVVSYLHLHLSMALKYIISLKRWLLKIGMFKPFTTYFMSCHNSQLM